MGRVVVLGLGRLGLPFATVLGGNRDLEVVGVDRRQGIVDACRAGRDPIGEPDTDLSRVALFTTDLDCALEGAHAACIVVNTPPQADGHLDHDDVWRALREVEDRRHLTAPGFFVALVSTVEPAPLRSLAASAVLPLVYHPQWIALGRVVRDLLHPALALYGVGDDRTLVDRVERWWGNAARPAVTLPYASAAIAKIALNAYLTQQIAFGGVLYHLVRRYVEDPTAVINALAHDPRFNRAYMKGGMPFGGPCFPKDLKAFIAAVRDAGMPSLLPEAVLETNDILARKVAHDVMAMGGVARVGLVGVAYKPGVAVTEGSPAATIRNELASFSGVRCRWWDPLVDAFEPLGAKTSRDDLWAWADALVLLHGVMYGDPPPPNVHVYNPWA